MCNNLPFTGKGKALMNILISGFVRRDPWSSLLSEK